MRRCEDCGKLLTMLSHRGRPRRCCLECRRARNRACSRAWKAANPERRRRSERVHYHLTRLVAETGLHPNAYLRRLAAERADS